MEQAVVTLLQAIRDLRHQLQATTMAQATDLTSVINAGRDMVNVIRNVALASDTDRLMECADKFHEYIEHILEVRYILYPWENRCSTLWYVTCHLRDYVFNSYCFKENEMGRVHGTCG
jgi:hypothetical protein